MQDTDNPCACGLRRPERRLVTLSSVTESDKHVKRICVSCPDRGQYSPEWPFRTPSSAAERGQTADSSDSQMGERGHDAGTSALSVIGGVRHGGGGLGPRPVR
jgi:hypothetical protein